MYGWGEGNVKKKAYISKKNDVIFLKQSKPNNITKPNDFLCFFDKVGFLTFSIFAFFEKMMTFF